MATTTLDKNEIFTATGETVLQPIECCQLMKTE